MKLFILAVLVATSFVASTFAQEIAFNNGDDNPVGVTVLNINTFATDLNNTPEVVVNKVHKGTETYYQFVNASKVKLIGKVDGKKKSEWFGNEISEKEISKYGKTVSFLCQGEYSQYLFNKNFTRTLQIK